METTKGSKIIYWGLIGTFAVLYVIVAIVSFLHAVEFFGLGNERWLSILLAMAYEVGQGAILFSMLSSKKGQSFLTWSMMLLMTTVQVTANVFATFKYMIEHASDTWMIWQRSILFWLEADNSEMYMVIISWIIGALLPLIALGMIALLAERLKGGNEEYEYDDDEEYEYEEEYEDEIIAEEIEEEIIPEKSKDEVEELGMEAATDPGETNYLDVEWVDNLVEEEPIDENQTTLDFDTIQEKPDEPDVPKKN